LFNNNTKAKLVQILDGSNYNCQQFFNAIEFDYNKLITSINTNIIIWERNSDNNYSYKQNISTGNNTNLVYINSNLFASYIYDNTIRFYDKNFNENGSIISNVSSYIEPLMMTMLNEELLGVCGRGNSIIYLININIRKVL
jgi:WD40 repeat protein